jgi:hypothetical protein
MFSYILRGRLERPSRPQRSLTVQWTAAIWTYDDFKEFHVVTGDGDAHFSLGWQEEEKCRIQMVRRKARLHWKTCKLHLNGFRGHDNY